ncbi:hypothetical protein L208DRAFT_1273623, partial [Tricholoma matsutake]
PFLVFILILGEYQDVIHVNHEPSFSDHVAEYLVHHCLEGRRWRTGQLTHPHCWLKQPPVHFEGCFPLISILDSDVVISPSDVQFRKPFHPS